MYAIVKNQLRTFLRNPGTMFLFIFPVIMIVVISSVTAAQLEAQGYTSDQIQVGMLVVLANIIVISTMATINNNFGSNFMELKNSVLIKRLGTTQVTKLEAVGGFVLWATLMAFFEIMYVTFIMWFVTGGTGWIADGIDFSNTNWIGVIYGLVWLIIVSFAIAFLFISISRNSESYQLMGFMYFFMVMYFGGLIFASTSIQWMNVISLFLPQTYSAHFVAGAFMGGYSPINEGGQQIGIWDMSHWNDEYVLASKSSLNVIMPIVYTAVFGTIAIRKFEFDA